MNGNGNRWQRAALAQLAKATKPLTTAEILDGMLREGFQHGSQSPISTLGARLAELASAGKVVRPMPRHYALPTVEVPEVQSGNVG